MTRCVAGAKNNVNSVPSERPRGLIEEDDNLPSPSIKQQCSTRYLWYVILLLCVVNVFNYMDRMALSVLMPFIKADMALSDAQLGLLTGFAFALFYAVCGIPIARWADRGTRRNIIAVTLAVWSAMTSLCGAAQNFWHLFVARIGVGVGEAGSFPTTQSLMCDYVPLERRSAVFAILNSGMVAGTMFGMGLAGGLGETIGWRWTFVVLGLPGLVLAVIVRLTLREPVRGFFDRKTDDEGYLAFGETVAALWGCRTYRLLLLYFVVSGFFSYGLFQWWPSFYVRLHGISISAAGLYIGVAIGIGSGIGMIGGGLLANKVARRDVRLPFVIGAPIVVLALPAALGSLFVSATSLSMFLGFLTVLLLGVPNGPILAGLFSVVPSRMRAMAGAVTVFCSSVLGFGLGPFCVGLLSDVLAPIVGQQSLRYALLVPISLIAAKALILLATSRTLRGDLKTAEVGREQPSDGSAPIPMAVVR